MKLILIIFLFGFGLHPALAIETPSVGMAALATGSKNFPCGKLLDFLEGMEKPYLSALWGTFGDNKACWKSYLNRVSSRPHVLQFYMSNESCRRKSNCTSSDFLPKLSVHAYNKGLESADTSIVSVVRKRMSEIKLFCDQSASSNSACLLTFGLESQFTEKALNEMVQIALEEGWSYEQLVHNPVKTAPFLKVGNAYYLEMHARNPRFRIEPERSIASLDGINPAFCKTKNFKNVMSTKKLTAWYRSLIGRTAHVAFWCAPHQGLHGDSLFAPAPLKRTFKVKGRELKMFRKVITKVHQELEATS